MVTGELKSKIDSLWEIFWTGGLTNPLDVIEQMTYLMFIHDLDDSDNTRAKEAAMLGLPYESVFAKEVQVGDRTGPAPGFVIVRFEGSDDLRGDAVGEHMAMDVKVFHGSLQDKASGYKNGIPNGIRTRVTRMKTWCPRPLDDRDARLEKKYVFKIACRTLFSSGKRVFFRFFRFFTPDCSFPHRVDASPARASGAWRGVCGGVFRAGYDSR